MDDKVDVLYYIIVPKMYVRKYDEEKSNDEMLTYLEFKVYPNVVFGMIFLLLDFIIIFCMVWAEIAIDFISELCQILSPLISFCFFARDCYCFFSLPKEILL